MLPASAPAICAPDQTRVALMPMDEGGQVVRLVPLTLDCAAGIATALVHDTSTVATLTLRNGLNVPFRSVLPLLAEGELTERASTRGRWWPLA